MKLRQQLLLVLAFAVGLSEAAAQNNLVPNGDFEDVERCVAGTDTLPISRFWFTPQDREIALDNPCFYGLNKAAQNTSGLNKSRGGYMETYGLFTQLLNISHHRTYPTVRLKQPLVADQQYYFEMSFKTLDSVENNWVTTHFTDNQSVAFSKDFPIYDFNVPNSAITLVPVLKTVGIIRDFKWHKLKGCFRAKGGERFLLIGNFKPNSETQRVASGLVSPTQFNSASFIIDNVVLTPVDIALRDTAICKGETLTLNLQNTLIDSLQFRWQDGSTTPQYKASKSEKIGVQVIFPTENCIAYGDFDLTVLEKTYQPPVHDTTICRGDTIVLTAGTGLSGEKTRWQNGSTARRFSLPSGGLGGEVSFSAKTENRCAAWTDSFRLKIKHCDVEVFVPTAFSPNGDGVNEGFQPFFKSDLVKIGDYDFRVFGRWGNLVFSSQNQTAAWDGTWRGAACAEGVYIWSLSVRLTLNGKEETRVLSGDVTLLR